MKKLFLLLLMLFFYSLVGHSQIITTISKDGGCYYENTQKSGKLKKGNEIKVVEILDNYYIIEYSGMRARINPSLVTVNEPLKIWLDKIQKDKILAFRQDSINAAKFDSLRIIKQLEEKKEEEQFNKEYANAFLYNKLTISMVLRKNGEPDREFHQGNYHQLWYYKKGILLNLNNGKLTKSTFTPIK